MEFVRTKEWDWEDVVPAIAVLIMMALVLVVFPITMIVRYHYADGDAGLYDEAATLAAESPELREALEKHHGDGVLTRSEVNSVRAMAVELRKSKAAQAFSE